MDSKITAHVQVRKTRSLPDGSECAKGARRQTGDRRPGFIVNYKFQNLDVYKLALDYLDEIYEIVGRLPDSEKFNLSSQIVRAATSVVLNIAEGSTGQSERSRPVSWTRLEIVFRDNSVFGYYSTSQLFIPQCDC